MKNKQSHDLAVLIIACLIALLMFGSCSTGGQYYKANKFSNNGCGGNAVPVFKMK